MTVQNGIRACLQVPAAPAQSLSGSASRGTKARPVEPGERLIWHSHLWGERRGDLAGRETEGAGLRPGAGPGAPRLLRPPGLSPAFSATPCPPAWGRAGRGGAAGVGWGQLCRGPCWGLGSRRVCFGGDRARVCGGGDGAGLRGAWGSGEDVGKLVGKLAGPDNASLTLRRPPEATLTVAESGVSPLAVGCSAVPV